MFPNSFSVTYLQARGRRHGSSVLHAFLADVTRWPAEDGPEPHGSSRWPRNIRSKEAGSHQRSPSRMGFLPVPSEGRHP